MSVFDFIQDILYKKKGDLLTNSDATSELVPFMINRWVSMHSPQNAILINETANTLWPAFQTKQEWYSFYLGVVPKSKFKKIEYIKKTEKQKKEKEEGVNEIKMLAKNLQISEREVAWLLSQRQ